MILEHLSSSTALPRASIQGTNMALGHTNIPGLLSHTFVGRHDELSWLKAVLKPSSENLISCRVGIHGLTGIGKTQLVGIHHFTVILLF